jgi:hypothetical protein
MKMNYEKAYYALIGNAKQRILEKNIYTEIHHIIPRCMGGSDENDNLVILTLREHFMAHLLLCKIYPKVKGLYLAVFLMSATRKIKTSRGYEIMRSQWKHQLLHNKFTLGSIDFIEHFAKWYQSDYHYTDYQSNSIKSKFEFDDEQLYWMLRNSIQDLFTAKQVMPNLFGKAQQVYKNDFINANNPTKQRYKKYKRDINDVRRIIRKTLQQEYVELSMLYYSKT